MADAMGRLRPKAANRAKVHHATTEHQVYVLWVAVIGRRGESECYWTVRTP